MTTYYYLYNALIDWLIVYNDDDHNNNNSICVEIKLNIKLFNGEWNIMVIIRNLSFEIKRKTVNYLYSKNRYFTKKLFPKSFICINVIYFSSEQRQ